MEELNLILMIENEEVASYVTDYYLSFPYQKYPNLVAKFDKLFHGNVLICLYTQN